MLNRQLYKPSAGLIHTQSSAPGGAANLDRPNLQHSRRPCCVTSRVFTGRRSPVGL